MPHELTLKIPHRFAPLLYRALNMARAYSRDQMERVYIDSLMQQVKVFMDTPAPTYVKITVLAIDGVPVDRK